MRSDLKAGMLLSVLALAIGLAAGCGKDGNMKAVGNPQGPMVPGNSLPYGSQIVWENNLTIIDKGVYRDFLEEFAMACNFYSWLNFGVTNCKSWDSRAYIVIGLFGQQLPAQGFATVFAYPDGYFNPNMAGAPAKISGLFEPSHADTKFELRSGGLINSQSYNAILRVVATGHPQDPQIPVELYYRGTLFAKAIVYRAY